MKHFLTCILIFSILIAASLTACEIWLRRQPNPYSVKDRYIHSNGAKVETAVLGSSHTYYGIIADSLSPAAVNLANISQNYEYDYRVLKHYIDEMPNLRRVIIPVSYFSFYDPPFENCDSWFLEIFYKIYMGIGKYPGLSRHSFELSHFPTFSGKIQSKILRRQMPECSETGFGLDYSLDRRDAGWKNSAAEACLRHTYRDFSNEAYNAAWLDSLLDLCADRQLEVILLTTPKYSAYRRLLDSRQYERTRHITDSIRAERDIVYLDYSADGRFADKDFFDADHLSDYGARHFTAILRDTLKSVNK